MNPETLEDMDMDQDEMQIQEEYNAYLDWLELQTMEQEMPEDFRF
jgi:hypothetical protein